MGLVLPNVAQCCPMLIVAEAFMTTQSVGLSEAIEL